MTNLHLAMAVAAVLLNAGCPTSGPRYVPDPDRAKDLPTDPQALVRLADRLANARLCHGWQLTEQDLEIAFDKAWDAIRL